MPALDRILTDVDLRVDRASGEGRVRTLARLTDLFETGAGAFTADQVALFDAIIQRFALAIETSARVELATRLAGLAAAPPGIVGALARDEIAVARPILAASPVLDDQDLMVIALETGTEHMVAMSGRPALSPALTDVLVNRGDGVVRQALAGNHGARFSPSGAATLVEHARRDLVLGGLLRSRTDLPPGAVRALLDMAKDAARDRLLSSLPQAPKAVEFALARGAEAVETGDVVVSEGSPASVEVLLGHPGIPTEEDVARFAAEGRRQDTIVLIGAAAGLSVAALERIFRERDNELLLVIGRARGWSWTTVRILLRLRDPSLSERHHLRKAAETFDGIAASTAARVVHFLKVREAAGRSPPRAPDPIRIGGR